MDQEPEAGAAAEEKKPGELPIPGGILSDEFVERTGVTHVEQLADIAENATKKISELSDKAQKLEEKLAAKENLPEIDPTPPPDPGDNGGGDGGGLDMSKWGLNTPPGYDEQFRQGMITNPLQTFGPLSLAIAQKVAEPLMAELKELRLKVGDREALDLWSEQSAECVELLGKDFVDEHQQDIGNYMKKKGSQPLNDNELYGYLSKIKESEGGTQTEAQENADAGKAAKAAQAAVADEGAPAPSGPNYDKMTSDEMEVALGGEGETGPSIVSGQAG